MKFFSRRSTITLLTSLLVLLMAPSASADESGLDFRVSPSSGSALSEGGDYFVVPMEPGDAVTQSVTITNPSSNPLDVQLAGVDAATAQMGGVDYGPELSKPAATGTWIELESKRVRLAPGDSADVAFKVAAPSDAPSGTHLAGIAVWVVTDDTRVVEGASATMNVQARRVLAVQVDLPGPAAPVLEIRGAEAEARPDGLYLGIDLFNSGNGFAKGTGTVTIEGIDGEQSFPLDTVVPRTGTTFPFRWAGSSIPSGSYDVSVDVDYGEGVVSYDGEVAVGSSVQDDLRGRGVGESARFLGGKQLTGFGALVLVVLAILFRSRLGLGRGWPRLPQVSLNRRSTPRRSPSIPHRGKVAGRGFQVPQPVTSLPRPEETRRRVPPPPPPPSARLAPPPPPLPRRGRAA